MLKNATNYYGSKIELSDEKLALLNAEKPIKNQNLLKNEAP